MMGHDTSPRRVLPVWVSVTPQGHQVDAATLVAVLMGDSQPPLDLVARVSMHVLARIETNGIRPGAVGWAEVEAAARSELTDAGATLPIVGLI